MPRYTDNLNQTPFLLSRGNEGYTPIIAYGRVESLDVADGELVVKNYKDIGIRPQLSAASILTIVSDSADDAAAGLGARIVAIQGLDANFNFLVEEITMNGLTPVNTILPFLRVNRCIVITDGSNNKANVGNINITSTTEVMCEILAGEGISQNSSYTVPAGYTGYLCGTDMYGSKTAGGQSPVIEFKTVVVFQSPASPPGFTSAASSVRFNAIKMDTAVADHIESRDALCTPVPEKSTIYVTATTTENDTTAVVRYSIVLVPSVFEYLNAPPPLG